MVVNGYAARVARTEREVHLHDPQTLYRHWEDEQWSPFAIELAGDQEQWPRMTGDDRSLVFWALSSLMVAEERITTKFSGLVAAYGTEEEATFLATQQVDEARHMQFYARFQDEVIADPQTIGVHVARAREQLSPAFSEIFDKALVQAHERLVASPADRGAKVEFVTTYHLVIEGTLGLTAFNFITRYLERESLLAGFVEGYSKIHHDEQRHIGYGTWFLQQAIRDDAGSRRQRPPDASRAAARGGSSAHSAGPRWHRLGCPRSERGRNTRVRGHRTVQTTQHRRSPARLVVSATRPSLGRRAAAEGLATFALVFAGCGAIVADQHAQGGLGLVGVALVFGLVIMVMVYATGHLSGAHINPAVTVAFTLTRHFPAREAVAYVAAQLVGAVAGALLLLAMWTDQPAGLGATVPTVSAGSALVYEIVLTAFLMFVIMAVATDSRAVGAAAAIAIGGTVGLDALFGGADHGGEHEPGPLIRPGAGRSRVD